MGKVKIIVSSCLMGERLRFDGVVKVFENHILKRWLEEGRIVPLCPEVEGGLPVPRLPAEIVHGNGAEVLDGDARILNVNGKDVTDCFINGAKKVLLNALENDVEIAILKDGSPSCGKNYIYDGSFSGKIKPLKGVTATLLEQNGIAVFSEQELETALSHLKQMEVTS